MSLQAFFGLTPKQEKSNVQRHIRQLWKTKNAKKPFLGADIIQVKSGTILQSMSLEEYAHQWLRHTIIEQRRKDGKKNDNSITLTSLEDSDSDAVETTSTSTSHHHGDSYERFTPERFKTTGF